ncbi:MAG: single-stranded DNA-binding protein [Bacteroidales bacterium]|nr:single-stranded DNA-binding protein [Bacteroidales bacterium]
MSVNRVTLVGNVGKDPEVRYLDNDVAVANFSLATTERGFTSKSGQEIPDKTEWHNIVAWRGLATLAEKYIKKGMKLYIEGKIRTRSWEDQAGVKKYMTEIFADSIELPGRENGGGVPATPSSSAPVAPTATPVADDSAAVGTADDLPF